MSGGLDAFDLGGAIGGITDFAADLGSAVTDFGTEFMSSIPSLDAFQIPSFDIPSLGGFGEIGSFAGSASWFDTFNPGSILSSIPSVSDFNISSLTSSLPSLSSIKSLASTVTSAVSTVNSAVQTGLSAYNKIAPAVNAASSAFGIQNPLTQIAQATQQVAGVGGQAAGILGAATGAISGLGKLNTNNLVSSSAAALGFNPATASSLTAKATSLFTTDPNSTNAVDKATGLPINTPREVDAYGLNILTAAEDKQLVRNVNPAFVNSFTDTDQATIDAINRIEANKAKSLNSSVDPASPTVSNYDQAVASRQELLANKAEIESSLVANEKVISDANKNIEEMQQNLLDPDLSDAQRETLNAQIAANQATIAEATNNIVANQAALSDTDDQLAADNQIIASTDASTTQTPGAVNPDEDPFEAARLAAEGRQTQTPTISPAELAASPYAIQTSSTPNTIVGTPGTLTNINVTNLVQQARQQQTLRNQTQTKAQSTDWRVKLRLAPNSTYLYNDPNGAGILAPLSAKQGTDGVIFPYTPAIETAYKANYTSYDLTHSNYRGYFYHNSYIDAVNMRCTFTAQDTNEANYLLAVIHFFRSVTKMFYGQDAQLGSPPPLVFLSGLGTYQFNEHPCVVSQFNYTLPPDVDYIRARSLLNVGTNLLDNRTRTTIPGNPLSYGINRLLNAGLFQGAQANPAAPSGSQIEEPTYVPTKMEIAITLLPMQSRQQVSTQFSLKGFSNGNLLKGGFW